MSGSLNGTLGAGHHGGGRLHFARRGQSLLCDGRGDSGDTLPYAIDREVEDRAALIVEAGGSAHLYGHSSGAALVLHAVAAGLPVERFVLHDPPYAAGDQSSQDEARRYGQEIRDLLGADKRPEAIEMFFRLTGMPKEMIAGMRETSMWPGLLALEPTLAYDSAVMGDVEHGGAVPDLSTELERFETSRTVVRFTPDQPLPAALVKRIVKLRLAEIDSGSG